MLDDFFFRSILASLIIALVSGPVGCLIIWQRKSYFADALSHSAILGMVFSLAMGINAHFGIPIILVSLALIFLYIEAKADLPSDTILGIMASASLAIGLVCISLNHKFNLNLEAFLLGDILTIGKKELGFLSLISVLIVAFLIYFWDRLLLYAINSDLAKVEIKNIHLIQSCFILILALFIAINIKIVGLLLINALLLISAAAARQISYSSKQMIFASSVLAFIGVSFGMFISYKIDIPIGPSITSGLFFLFLMMILLKKLPRIFTGLKCL